ncbi:MAG: FMN-binding protein, partial [Eubacteriales bacterium]|nr:FMN-binding protein [Eubacteriales bacterium]
MNVKKWYSLLLCVVIFAVSVCGPAFAEDVTITKSAQGFGGEVSVSITFSGDDIAAVEIVGDQETANVGQAAIPTLTQQVLDAGSAEIDGVSGASITSQAVRDAVTAVISEKNGVTADAIAYTPGTYEGEAYGNTSTISVAVTLGADRIENIEITNQNETPV